jgi:NTE family protein
VVVVLDRGSLAEAMRATMAIPGVFTPVSLDGRLLVDGGPSTTFPRTWPGAWGPTSSSR